METLLSTVLSTTIFLTTAFTSAPTTPHTVFTRVLPEKDYVGFVVEKPNSLAKIAENAYGSDAHWTTLWNDNAWITDPENVAKDTIVKIRMQKPEKPVQLVSNLSERNNSVTEKKNEAYLKQISLLTNMESQPTVAPAQASPVAQPQAASPVSEEAITYLGNCEAGMNPAKNTGNGYYGAFQFSYGTWKSLNTGYERADLAPIEVQKAAVKQLIQRSNIHAQFPGCASKMRNAGLI